MRQLLWIIRRQ